MLFGGGQAPVSARILVANLPEGKARSFLDLRIFPPDRLQQLAVSPSVPKCPVRPSFA